MASREFDIILWGCTGYTGKLVARLLSRLHGIRDPSIKIALAGRSEIRLRDVAMMMLQEALKSESPRIRESAKVVQTAVDKDPEHMTGRILPLICTPQWAVDLPGTEAVADELAKRATVIIAMSGPFADVGEPMVKACAINGTDYVDISGEYLWVKKMREKYNSVALKSGCRIIPCCGYDYLLNDVGVAAVERYAISHYGGPAQEITQIPTVVGSVPSGGTMRTIFKMAEKVSCFDYLCQRKDHEFVMCPSKPESRVTCSKNRDICCTKYSKIAQAWLYPSIMGKGMTRFIHWTNYVQGHKYGQDFTLTIGEKASGFGSGVLKASSWIFMMCTLFFLSRFPFCSRRLAAPAGVGKDIAVLEKPGNLVRMHTIGLFTPTNETSSSVKIEHTIEFNKGEAYMMTALGVICAALACLQKREARPVGFASDNYGVSCPSHLLDVSIEDKLRAAGLNMKLTETTL